VGNRKSDCVGVVIWGTQSRCAARRESAEANKHGQKPSSSNQHVKSQLYARPNANRITTLEAKKEDVKKCLVANSIYGSMYLTQIEEN